MTQIVDLDKFKVPLGGQEIELQQFDHAGGGDELAPHTHTRGKTLYYF